MSPELDYLFRKEQFQDYVRETEREALAKEAGHQKVGNVSKMLLVLPVLLVSLGSRLLALSINTGRHSL